MGRQVVTTNHKKEKAPITKEKLAYEVVKCIKASSWNWRYVDKEISVHPVLI